MRDIAMQVAAAHPQFVSKDEVPADVLKKEREIQRERALTEGKPEKMVDKIAEGRMAKFYEEVCLLEQPFIKENTISVSELIKTAAGKIGGTIQIARFARYKVGDAGDATGCAGESDTCNSLIADRGLGRNGRARFLCPDTVQEHG